MNHLAQILEVRFLTCYVTETLRTVLTGRCSTGASRYAQKAIIYYFIVEI